MFDLTPLQNLAIWALPVLFAVTVHEAAHGWVAARLGDKTAWMLGRVTLNPIKHVDPMGTLLVPGLLILMSSPFVMGWAKPVPITPQNLRNPKRDMALVAAAGPLSNLLMAIIWAALAKLGFALGGALDWVATPLVLMGYAGIAVNAMFFVFNLLPLPPLDGGRILVSVLPDRLGWQLSRIEPYGLLILMALVLTPVAGYTLVPAMAALQKILMLWAGI